MDAITSAIYDPPKEGLPTLVVVFFPHQDSILCRPTKDRAEAEALLAQLHRELGTNIAGQHGNA